MIINGMFPKRIVDLKLCHSLYMENHMAILTVLPWMGFVSKNRKNTQGQMAEEGDELARNILRTELKV